MVIVLLPTFNAIGPEAVLEVTVVPFTFIVALALPATGLSVIEVVK